MKLISLLMLTLTFSNACFAECDFSTGIVKVEDFYIYSRECHLQVGRDQKELNNKRGEVAELRKAIELKDLAFVKQQERVDLWQNTSFKMEEKFSTYDSLQNKNNLLYFVAGVGLTALSVWGAGQLVRK